MDAASALADLTEISSQIEVAVVFDRDGDVLGSTPPDDSRAERLAGAARQLIAAAAEVSGAGGRRPTQVEVALRAGSLFVVDGETTAIVAATTSEPTSGLVFYDLKTCLRSLDLHPPENGGGAARRRSRKTADA
jgi:predicted regulator of Ras-like GTPase activity (Roadblock/LC7/MglB family)